MEKKKSTVDNSANNRLLAWILVGAAIGVAAWSWLGHPVWILTAPCYLVLGFFIYKNGKADATTDNWVGVGGWFAFIAVLVTFLIWYGVTYMAHR